MMKNIHKASKRNKTKSNNDRTTMRNTKPSLNIQPNASDSDLNIMNINIAIFGLFIALTFSYFVYFSHQLTNVKFEVYSKILEINAINHPFPWSFLSISGHSEYYYIKRREILFKEFRAIKDSMHRKKLDEPTLSNYGKQVQKSITQISYFFPYKRMLDFQKNGSATFDPNRFEAIETVDNLEKNIPGYAVPPDSDKKYSPEFLKQQVNHIIESHRRFTLELIDGKDRIIHAMTLANGLNSEYDKSRLKKYIDGLIVYLEHHYRLAIPLGLTLKKYDYFINKAKPKLIIILSAILFINFLSGVVAPPLFYRKARNNRLFLVVPLLTFVVGVIILFKESIYSLSL